jgi:GntR family transcriptional regulator/MocR family aminotransferase
LLAAIDAQLGARVQVRGAAAGLHLMLVPRRAGRADVERMVRRAAARRIGVYSTTALHLRPPTRAALLLGHGALSEEEIQAGIARLAEAVA